MFKRQQLVLCDTLIPRPGLFRQHNSLSTTLESQTEALRAIHPPSSLRSHHILLFICMLSHALTLCLCSGLRKALSDEAENYHELATSWQHRALKAVFGIIGLSKSIASLSYSSYRHQGRIFGPPSMFL
ncbi:uncharacterized protein JN550_004038 [Neoarthrinium moseri]|uniref:uncharacterized protein n=1 Tax=Neoarthrinium moseri TaxID=1658444 RepID=UPI001FDDA5A7|nr:uncharacterized protein JN550_004038 [Neoarthrinium moseri]KAI1872319.1 hypothetical protein JN550_004038 [Neoarthrinium moseri]